MSIFDDLVGQDAVHEILGKALSASREELSEHNVGHTRQAGISNLAMAQSWLFTGPPGSGRSIAARMFAAGLECTGKVPGCGTCHACHTAMAGTHPDVLVVKATRLSIVRDEVRDLVRISYTKPVNGKWRVIVLEDADRMSEGTFNILLKAIEEPPTFTVWLLCTPSPADVLPTIRSRCRHVNLSIPRPEAIAELLSRQVGASYEQALNAARAAQSHVGAARGLLLEEDAAQDRRFALTCALGIETVGDAAFAAREMIERAKAVVDKRSAGVNEREVAELRRSLGIQSEGRVPPAFVKQFKDMADKQKKRLTRMRRDEIDRGLVNMLSLFRDVLVVQLGAEVSLVNADLAEDVHTMAERSDAPQSIRRMDAIATARTRLQANVAEQLLLEAVFVALRPQG